MNNTYKLVKTYPGSPELGEVIVDANILGLTSSFEESEEVRTKPELHPRYWRRHRNDEFVMSVNIPVAIRNLKSEDYIITKLISKKSNELSSEITYLDKKLKKGFKDFVHHIDFITYLEYAAFVDIEVSSENITATIVFEHDKVLHIEQDAEGNIISSNDSFQHLRKHTEDTAEQAYLWYSFKKLSELHNKIHNYEPYQELELTFIDQRTYAVKHLNEVLFTSEHESQNTFGCIDVYSNTLYKLFEDAYYNMTNKI